MKILIVEDDDNSRIYLERALLSQGYSVESASNGIKAIEKIKEALPDLIISDIMMPEMDGYELCRKMKTDEQFCTIPFIFYTATYIESKDENLAMSLGASRFLIKPMEMDDLFTAIKSVIDEHLEKSLEVPVQPLVTTRELNRLQLEVLAKKLNKKVCELEKEREVSRRRENKYRKLLESMMDGFAYVDMGGTIRESNETYKKILGYDDKELKQLAYSDITPEKWHALEQKIIQDQVLIRGFSDIYEKEYRKKDGTIFPVELHTFLIRNEQGENEGMWAIVRDITERKRAETGKEAAESALRETANFLKQLINAIPVPIFYKNLQGCFQECNTAFENFLGVSRESILGKTVFEISSKEFAEISQKSDQEIIRSHSAHRYETILQHADGTPHDVQITKAVHTDLHGNMTGVVGIIHDMTEYKKSTQERIRLEQQLLQAQKLESVGRLAGGVAHDFNNMLSVVIGYAEMALDKLEPSDPLHKDIDQVLESAMKSAGLTRQLLAMARKQTFEIQPLNLNKVINDFMTLIQRTLRENVEIQARLSQNLMVMHGDIGQIEQVLMNLAVNAQDAMPEGGKMIIETKDIYLDEAYAQGHPDVDPGPYVMMTISDTGAGMDSTTVQNIFEPFFTTKEIGKGTGLGLSTVYGIVKQHGGSIWVYSEPGKGTRFTIYFPAKTTVVQNNLPDIQSAPVSKGNETILFVEDQAQVRQMACKILKRLGYTVLEAPNGKTALEIIESHNEPIHLLVTDLIMPEMNGKLLYERLAKMQKGLKVLYTSGYTADIINHHGVLDNGIKFLQKPFNIKDFAAKIRKVIDGE